MVKIIFKIAKYIQYRKSKILNYSDSTHEGKKIKKKGQGGQEVFILPDNGGFTEL